jgi:PAS domain S-box-containing protein
VAGDRLGIERKRAEAALHARSGCGPRQSALDAVVAMDAEGRIQGWNRQAEAIFGWTRDEAIGRSLAQTIIPPGHRAAHSAGLARFLATEGRSEPTHRGRRSGATGDFRSS